MSETEVSQQPRMKIIHDLRQPGEAVVPTVVALGNFDGVHLGHQAIIEAATRRARELSARSAVFTFWPHPQRVLRPAHGQELLCLRGERAELIAGLGVDLLVEQAFDSEFSSLEADWFFKELLLKGLGAVALVVGYDFAFGKNRTGNLDVLRSLCQEADVELIVMPALEVDGVAVSSSRIRRHLVGGEVSEAARLLGRPFFYRGVVIHGDGRGNRIGIPTANLVMPDKIRIPNGVYATVARVAGAADGIPSVTNVGVRPTFYSAGASPMIETHFLDAKLDVYDKGLTVEFVGRIREERKFSGVDELKAQIADDILTARKILPN